jgi:hypothetical protein
VCCPGSSRIDLQGDTSIKVLDTFIVQSIIVLVLVLVLGG